MSRSKQFTKNKTIFLTISRQQAVHLIITEDLVDL